MSDRSPGRTFVHVVGAVILIGASSCAAGPDLGEPTTSHSSSDAGLEADEPTSSTPESESSAKAVTNQAHPDPEVLRVYDLATGEWNWGITVDGASAAGLTWAEVDADGDGWEEAGYWLDGDTTFPASVAGDAEGTYIGLDSSCSGDWRFCLVDDITGASAAVEAEATVDGFGNETVVARFPTEVDGAPALQLMVTKRLADAWVTCGAITPGVREAAVLEVCLSMRDLVRD